MSVSDDITPAEDALMELEYRKDIDKKLGSSYYVESFNGDELILCGKRESRIMILSAVMTSINSGATSINIRRRNGK